VEGRSAKLGIPISDGFGHPPELAGLLEGQRGPCTQPKHLGLSIRAHAPQALDGTRAGHGQAMVFST
jgi:hypothetical protein